MADNLGWFEDGKWNIETHAKAKKITSPEVKAILDGFIANMKWLTKYFIELKKN